VNRLLRRDGDIPESWRSRLDNLLGDQSWYADFYRFEPAEDLFGDQASHLVKTSMEVIGRRFVDRLKTIFPGVAEHPGVLRNSTNNPLYLLCFAAANERGAKPALKIANDLLRRIS
jgi:three-Cys-motif partner protein